MNFTEKCKERFEEFNTVFCMGLDPVLDKIPLKNKSDIYNTLKSFYFSLLDNFHKMTLAVKPNIAFYEQYGYDGINALKEIIKRAQKYKIPVILDAKRGDIGNTAKAYAKAAFKELNADSITLSPYLGTDSLIPFFEYKEKGFFILVRTSNPGSSDFQLIKTEKGNYLYQEVANKVAEWNHDFSSGIGGVAGATHIDELKEILKIFKSNEGMPILIPGVGKQGGDFKSVIQAMRDIDYPLHKVFINSSSKINYAYQHHPGKDYIEAASIEIDKLKL